MNEQQSKEAAEKNTQYKLYFTENTITVSIRGYLKECLENKVVAEEGHQ